MNSRIEGPMMRALRPQKGVDAGKCDEKREQNLKAVKIVGFGQGDRRRGCLAAYRDLLVR